MRPFPLRGTTPAGLAFALLLLALGACSKDHPRSAPPRPAPPSKAQARAPAKPPAAAARPAEPEPEPEPEPAASVDPPLSPDPEVHAAVVGLQTPSGGPRALRLLSTKLDAAIPALIAGLRHRKPNVRSQSAMILVMLHHNKKLKLGKEAVVGLKNAIAQERDAQVRALIVKAAARSRDSAFLKPLLTALKTDASGSVRANAAEGLGLIRKREAIEPLLAALADKEVWVRMNAATALRRLKARSAVRTLVGLLRDDNGMVRKRAHKALVELTGRRLPADPEAWSGVH